MELNRILPHRPSKYEVMVVNDGSNNIESSSAKHNRDFWRSFVTPFKLRYGRIKENQGFGFAMNKGAENSTGDILVFLSNDVEVNVDFTAEIEALLEQDKNLLIGAQVLYHDTGWNTINGIIIPYVNGWFVSCHRDAWKRLKGFDWLTYGIADYEDIDLSLTALSRGMKLKQLTCSNNHGLRHIGAQTIPYSPKREAHTKENQKKFIAKWESRIEEISEQIRNSS